MGELLNGLLRAVVVGLWFVVLLVAFYVSASGWSADFGRDMWRWQAQHTTSQKVKNNRITRLNVGWPKTTWYLVKHPSYNWKVLKKAFPFLTLRSQRIGKGNFAPRSMTRERFIYHILPAPLIALLLMFFIEFGIYPMLRHKLAKWLATQENNVFGSTADLPLGDGFVLGRNTRLARSGGGNPHILTIGPSGNGKSACQVLPSLLQLPDDCACVVTDPKAELLARAAPYLQSKGHKIIVIGPLVGYGYGWDPLRDCIDVDDVRELARQLIAAGDEGGGMGSGSNWNNMSKTCLSAYLLQAFDDGLGLADGLQSLYADEASGELISSDAARLDYRLFESMAGSSATVGSVAATIQGACSVWMMDKVVGFMAHKPTFSMDDIRAKKAAVFLVTSASDAKAVRPILWLFYTRLFSHLAQGGQTDVRLILDEMANLGALEGIDHALNLLRGAGVQMHGFVQNLSQLRAVYGSDIGDVVAESFGTICVMSGLRKDAKALAELLGLQGVVRPSYSTMDENMRAQFSANDKQAMEGSLLRQIQKDEVLIISGNLKPVITVMKPWYAVRRLRDRCLLEGMRADWGKIPESVKTEFFGKFPKIKPIGISLPNLAKKTEKKSEGKPQAEGLSSGGEFDVLDSIFDRGGS